MAAERWAQAALRTSTRPGADGLRSARERSNSYDRAATLSRLLPLWPADIADPSPEARRAIVRRLERALRAERRKGHAGHAAYDLERHLALARALAAERTLAIGANMSGAKTAGAKAAGLASAPRTKTKGPADRSTGPEFDRFDQPQASSRLRC